jgi:hypothetical protein
MLMPGAAATVAADRRSPQDVGEQRPRHGNLGHLEGDLAPFPSRVAVRNFTFEACSGFTRVTARRGRSPTMRGLCFEASARPVTRTKPLDSYQIKPATIWVDPSSTGDLRRWGALGNPG